MQKIYNKVVWENNTTPALNEDNLNQMSDAIDEIDQRVVDLAGTIMEDVPQIKEALEEAEGMIDDVQQYVTQAQGYAQTASTKAGEASASASAAAGSATAASGSASTASTKAGEASTSASTASTKAGEAAASASTASTKAGEAATSATNAANSATEAAASASQAAAWSAHPPYIGNNGNWFVYDTTTEAYVDSGIDASITMNVGTVTTLEAGQPATVTNSGTNTDAIFNFGIPQGIQGIQGPQGERGIQGEQGIQGIQGETGATGATPNITMTATVDAVSSENPSVNITKSGTAENPSFALAFSGLKGLKGDTGETGQTGQTGPAGSDGFSPEVTISHIAGGHRVTIIDKDHPTGQSFDVMDGAGSGDMLAATYDPNGNVAAAGGIADYVDGVLPTKTSDLTNDSNFVADSSYVHTDNNYTTTEKNKLGGIASGAEVNTITGVKGSSESSYRTGNVSISPTDLGLGNVGNFKAVSTVASQGLTTTEKSNARTNIGAGTITSIKMNGSTISTSGEADLGNVITSHQSLAACYQTGDAAETSLADGDYFPFYDTSASGKKKTLWSNIKSVLKTYFDSLYKGASVHDTWSEVTSKPFASIGSGLTVLNNVLKASQYDITLNHTGTASATVTRQQNLAATGASGVNTEVAIDGTRYLESSTKTTSNGVDTFSFTNANITTTAVYDFYADVYGVAPSEVSVSTGSMSVKFKSTDSVTECRVYIK